MGGSMVLLVVCTPKFTKFRLATIIGAGHALGLGSGLCVLSRRVHPVWQLTGGVHMNLCTPAGLFGTLYAAIYGIAMAKKIGPIEHSKVNL